MAGSFAPGPAAGHAGHVANGRAAVRCLVALVGGGGLRRSVAVVALAAAVLFPGPLLAQPQEGGPSRDEELIVNSRAFLDGHPDVRHRNEGIQALQGGDAETAIAHFKRAAWYGDKLSQAAYAELLWEGSGVGRDPSLAYAWMDLAAERMSPTFIVRREHFWSQLDQAQRLQALELGQSVYAEYGDDVAQPRQERVMRSARRSVGGPGRVASVMNLNVELWHPEDGWTVVRGTDLYAGDLWERGRYWDWQDHAVDRALRTRITVGDIETADTPAQASPEGDGGRPSPD